MRTLKRRLGIHRRLLACQQRDPLAQKLSDAHSVAVPTLRIVQLPSGRMVCLGATASEALSEGVSPERLNRAVMRSCLERQSEMSGSPEKVPAAVLAGSAASRCWAGLYGWLRFPVAALAKRLRIAPVEDAKR